AVVDRTTLRSEICGAIRSRRAIHIERAIAGAGECHTYLMPVAIVDRRSRRVHANARATAVANGKSKGAAGLEELVARIVDHRRVSFGDNHVDVGGLGGLDPCKNAP